MIDKRLRGSLSRAEGQRFENLIESACRRYEQLGLAKIEKTPEPMRPIGAASADGKFLACFTKRAQPDYKGVLRGGRAVVFEAKHTRADRIAASRLTVEQCKELEEYAQMGAECFVLVGFGMQRVYRIPWQAWRRMGELYGRQYVKEADIQNYKINQMNFLKELV